MPKMFICALVVALALPNSQACAEPRIEFVQFAPDKVISVKGQVNRQTTIEFGADERIENIAIGDSSLWQITPNKRSNIVFAKPLHSNCTTNMTVVTNLRRYLFDLHSRGVSSPGIYLLKFTYPDAVSYQTLEVHDFDSLPAEPKTAASAQIEDVDRKWSTIGDKSLRPAEVYDDGKDTYVVFADGDEIPAISIVGSDKAESPANFSADGSTVKIQGVASRYVLRSGNLVTYLNKLAD